MRQRRLTASDAVVLDHHPQRVYQAVSAFERYPDWWPRSLSLRVLHLSPSGVGSRLAAANGPLVRWIVTVVAVEENRSVSLRYSDGAWLGDARWTLSADGNRTRLTYDIDLEIVPLWLRGLSRVIDLGREHSRQMTHVFAALDAWLSDTTKVPRAPSQNLRCRKRGG